MQATFTLQGKQYQADLRQPLPIGTVLRHGQGNPIAWEASLPDFSPVRAGGFIGSVKEGGPVNFFNVSLNPHGNGTHTESYGHISPDQFPLSEALAQFLFSAQLLTVAPEQIRNGDLCITGAQLSGAMEGIEALIVRTLPNSPEKTLHNYSGSNPPYFEAAALEWLSLHGVMHLLTDLPSVDREQDEGKLAGHHAWWQYPANTRKHATITELVYVPDEVKDGIYLLNLMAPRWELDAAPSNPVLYKAEVVKGN
jgi:arylformamidase